MPKAVGEALPGQRFFRWTVLGAAPRVDNGHCAVRAVECQCVCGARQRVRVNTLLRGESRGCRACADRDNTERVHESVRVRPGERYSELTVLREIERRPGEYRRVVMCRCECRAEVEVDLLRLVHGEAKRCPECNGRRGARPGARALHFVAGMGGDVRDASGFTRSELCATWDDAVARLVSARGLNDAERDELQATGFVRLWRPREEGASYVEIVRCDCKTPEVHVSVEAAE